LGKLKSEIGAQRRIGIRNETAKAVL
jgi:hypothetical protein